MNSLTAYDYGFRIYNPAIGKFLSVDPLTKQYPWYTPYQFAGNVPIAAIDLDGGEPEYVADKTADGKVHLKPPVVTMFAKLYGESFFNSGIKANIVIDQKVHDRITKYESGAITLGFEMIFTENYRNASPEDWLKLISHEKVHVKQFIKIFGSSFITEERYKEAVANWKLDYALSAVSTWFRNIGKNKDAIHDDIKIEEEASTYENLFVEFFNGENFVRKRKIDGNIIEIQENRIINLLKGLNDSEKKYLNAKSEKEKEKQKERYNANFKALIKLVEDFKEKKKNENSSKSQGVGCPPGDCECG